MKNAIILHGTNGHSRENWFGWLKKELEKHGWKVWVPDLPQSERPDIKKYTTFIFSNKEWKFAKETIIIGHSSGAAAILGLLQKLPNGIKIDNCYFVGVFKDTLGWDNLRNIFPEILDFEKIIKKAKEFVFIHSDNDPYCPLSHAEYLSNKLGGELIIKKGQKHFSISTMGKVYEKFPFLLNEIISRQKRKV